MRPIQVIPASTVSHRGRRAAIGSMVAAGLLATLTGMPAVASPRPEPSHALDGVSKASRGDLFDHTPTVSLGVHPTGPMAALIGASVPITFRLEDPLDGRLLSELSGVRVTLTARGSAVF